MIKRLLFLPSNIVQCVLLPDNDVTMSGDAAAVACWALVTGETEVFYIRAIYSLTITLIYWDAAASAYDWETGVTGVSPDVTRIGCGRKWYERKTHFANSVCWCAGDDIVKGLACAWGRPLPSGSWDNVCNSYTSIRSTHDKRKVLLQPPLPPLPSCVSLSQGISIPHYVPTA